MEMMLRNPPTGFMLEKEQMKGFYFNQIPTKEASGAVWDLIQVVGDRSHLLRADLEGIAFKIFKGVIHPTLKLRQFHLMPTTRLQAGMAEGIDLNQSFEMNEMNTRAGSSEKKAQVIDLSDNEEDSSLEEKAWHNMDPQNDVQGPFSLVSLRRWSNLDYFPPGFTMWKSGQSQKQEVLLSELLRQMFPH